MYKIEIVLPTRTAEHKFDNLQDAEKRFEKLSLNMLFGGSKIQAVSLYEKRDNAWYSLKIHTNQ